MVKTCGFCQDVRRRPGVERQKEPCVKLSQAEGNVKPVLVNRQMWTVFL